MNGHRLYLRHLAVEPNPSGSLHVPGLIERVQKQVVDQEGFMALIANSPYDPEQHDLWREHAYAPVAEAIYSVNDDFRAFARRCSRPDSYHLRSHHFATTFRCNMLLVANSPNRILGSF